MLPGLYFKQYVAYFQTYVGNREIYEKNIVHSTIGNHLSSGSYIVSFMFPIFKIM